MNERELRETGSCDGITRKRNRRQGQLRKQCIVPIVSDTTSEQGSGKLTWQPQEMYR